MKCPKCGSENIVKNGSIHNKKPKFKCKDCGRQFVERPSVPRIDDKTIAIIETFYLKEYSYVVFAESWAFQSNGS